MKKAKKAVETKEETTEVCNCPNCAKREAEEAESDIMNFAILLALMPALTITFLSNAGFF